MVKYFESYNKAMAFIKQAGIDATPFKAPVWVYPSTVMVWAVRVETRLQK